MAAPPRKPVERYFSLHYGINQAPLVSQSAVPTGMNVDFSDSCVARHHNGMCVVCLSPRHPIVMQKLQVLSVEYRREMQAVSGKRKRGGIFVEGRTGLCKVECAGGLHFNVQCTVRGVIVEYNDALKERPALVGEQPLEEGYMAVIMPPGSQMLTSTDMLCEADEYGKIGEAPTASGS